MENKEEDLRLSLSLRTSYLSDSTVSNHDHDHDHYPHDSNRERSEEEDGNGRKKLRLSKLQSSTLEDTFKRHHTLNPKEKMALAKELNLRPRQVEVWFQNRRARKKLKKTEVDCEMLKKCCENLSQENRRLKKELMELKSIKVLPRNLPSGGGGGTLLAPPTTTLLSVCPSCERLNGGGGGGGVVAHEQISGYRGGSSNISSISFHRHQISSFY